MDLLKGELVPRARHVTSTLNGNQVTGIGDKRVTSVKEEEDQEPMTVPQIEMEPKNWLCFVVGETCSYSDTCNV
jgi:hypothetical protein